MVYMVIKCTDDQKKTILKLSNTSEAHLEENVKIIQNWIKTQPHIPEMPEPVIIEKFLLLNKFVLDKVKKRISFYYVIRPMIPDIFNIPPNHPAVISCRKSVDYIPLPDLAPDLGRVIMFQILEETSDLFDPISYMAYAMFVTEVRLREDYSFRDVHVYDMKNIKLSHMAKLSPVTIKKITIILRKLYNNTEVYVNLINVAPFVHSFMHMLKSMNPPKVQEKFVIHNDLESLYKCVPKDNLPYEYGGTAGTMQELREMWAKKLEEYDPIYSRLRSLKIDKDLLPENLKIDDNYGVHGNFKKLDID